MPKLFIRFALPLAALTVYLALPASAQPVYEPYTPKDWKLPEADAQKWVERLKKLCRNWDWTVTAKGNDIDMQRVKPVQFANRIFSPSPTKGSPKQGASFEGTYRLTLRFGPEMSLDKWEELDIRNDATEAENVRIQRKNGLSRRYNELISFGTPEQKAARQKAYDEESKKLVFQELPDFYASGYSVTLYHSWRWFQFLDSDEKVAEECNSVREYLLKYFGSYNYLPAVGSGGFGKEEPQPANPE